jgi:hypothetical protein
MIEPAALGRPVIIGPFTGNFADAMSHFREGGAMIEIKTGDELGAAVAEILASPARAGELGRRAQNVVVREKGASERHAGRVLQVMGAADEHRTSNIQHRTSKGRGIFAFNVRGSILGVRCSHYPYF